MAYGDDHRRGSRLIAMVGSVGLTALIGVAMASLASVRLPMGLDEALDVSAFTLPLPLPPPPPPAPPAAPKPDPSPAPRDAQGAAAPVAKKARATPVVVPKPDRPLPTKNKVTVADKPGDGGQPKAGAGDRDGPGSGAGGVGMGTGSGLSGTGPGGGGTGGTGRGVAARPRLVSGTITNADRSKAARREKAQGTVTVVYTVTTSGRAVNCAVLKNSGFPSLDATTCRLIEERFRYMPARDGNGQPIAVDTGWQQKWWYEGG